MCHCFFLAPVLTSAIAQAGVVESNLRKSAGGGGVKPLSVDEILRVDQELPRLVDNLWQRIQVCAEGHQLQEQQHRLVDSAILILQ